MKTPYADVLLNPASSGFTAQSVLTLNFLKHLCPDIILFMLKPSLMFSHYYGFNCLRMQISFLFMNFPNFSLTFYCKKCFYTHLLLFFAFFSFFLVFFDASVRLTDVRALSFFIYFS